MAGFVAKKWIKKSIERLDTVFGGKKQEKPETEDPKLDPVEAYNAYMREAFRLLAQDPYLTEDERQLYRKFSSEPQRSVPPLKSKCAPSRTTNV